LGAILPDLRTTCTKRKSGNFQCYRGMRYNITKEKQDVRRTSEIQLKLIEEQREALEEEYQIKKRIAQEQTRIEELKHKIEENNFVEEYEEPSKPWFDSNLF